MMHKHSWKISCSHTPETIDRILLPVRKRGLKVVNFHYEKIDEDSASCLLEFETDQEAEDRIFKNMQRIHDIRDVEIVNNK